MRFLISGWSDSPQYSMRALVIIAALVAFSSEHYVLAQPIKELLKLVELFNATEPIELEFCKDFGYSKTPKFNFLGVSQKDALSNPTINGVLLLEKMGCTNMAKAFICSLLTPKPLDTFGAAPPCRSICGSIEDSCREIVNTMMSIPYGSCKSDMVGAKYRGKISKTRSGLQCQKWNLQAPHAHSFQPEWYPQEDLSENYCRNPDREPNGPWCYTASQRRWEYCDVPLCHERFNMRCGFFPTDGCMDLKVKVASGKLEMKLKGEPKLQDLLDFKDNKLPLLKKCLGSA